MVERVRIKVKGPREEHPKVKDKVDLWLYRTKGNVVAPVAVLDLVS